MDYPREDGVSSLIGGTGTVAVAYLAFVQFDISQSIGLFAGFKLRLSSGARFW